MARWTDYWAGAQFFARLPFYLARPVRFNQARKSLAQRLAGRNAAFLDKLRWDIFARPESPYLPLLREAGCEYGDIESSVGRDGLEETLRSLFRAGVYLTVDEFKGRNPVRRGSVEMDVGPARLQAPRASYHMPASSGGSRSAGTPVMIDLAFIRTCASNAAVCLDAHGGRRWRKASWESPGAGLRFRMVKYAGFGDPLDAAFSFFDPASDSIQPYFRWNLRAMRWASPLSGRPLPWPRHAPLSEPKAFIDWIQRTLGSGETPHTFTFPSAAVTACRWAIENGRDIAGARFTISGEPITAARIGTIESTGAQVIPRYGTMEVGAIGYGCRGGTDPDHLHLLSDMHALIQAGEDGPAAGIPAKGLLMTSLHPQSPFVMLNVSMGDQAEISGGICDCPLRAAGWTTVVSNIRSYEKLTGGGVTFEAGEVVPVLEETLPGRFGGAPTDYQLIEAESAEGDAVLHLRVHPRLGELEGAEVAEAFLDAFAGKSAASEMMVRRWRDSGTLVVERKAPATTKAGKINFLHAGPESGLGDSGGNLG